MAARSDDRVVWSETDTARVKTVYDDQGNIAHQQAWDKRSGREISMAEVAGTRDPHDGNLNVYEPTEARPYGMLADNLDGDYEEHRGDPRPAFKTNHMTFHGDVKERPAYEFSVGLGFWHHSQEGTIEGTEGAGEGDLAKDDRSTYMLNVNNQRAGFGITQIKHRQSVTGTFNFQGSNFNQAGGAVFDSNVVLYDSFFRWPLFDDGRNYWFDYLLGVKVLDVDLRVEEGTTRARADGIAPLLQAGLMGQWTLVDNIRFRGFFKAAGGGFSGSSGLVLDGELELVYTFPGKRFEYSRMNQFSVGYKGMNLSFTTEDDTTRASGSVLAYGPFAQFSAYF